MLLSRLATARAALKSTAPRLAVGQMSGKRFPMIPVDLCYRYGPKSMVEDKAGYAQLFILFAAYHAPFQGAEYHSTWKSPRYLARRAELHNTGALDFNLRVKRDCHYLPHECFGCEEGGEGEEEE